MRRSVILVAALVLSHNICADDVIATQVRVAPELGSVTVRACGPKDLEFAPPDARFRDYYNPPEPHTWVRDGCVQYAFSLSSAAESRRSRDVVRVGSDVIAAASAWLLPAKSNLDRVIEFELPPGVYVSAPWQTLAPRTRMRASANSSETEALVAFMHLSPHSELVGDTRLDIAMLDSLPPVNPADVAIWVSAAARNVTLAYGRFPVARVQVLVVPVLGVWPNRRSSAPLEAVPFARVLRSGGFTVQFFVNQKAPLREYLADWTATHEFSHLLLPYVQRSDAWVSEGFASYYQNVLMARGGVLDERRAWQKLVEGFERGRRERYDDTLDESIRHHGPNMLMRMYWSGAAVALLADVAMRRTSPPTSLDTVLQQLAGCCLDIAKTWTGLELFTKLDELAGRAVFTPLYYSTARATEFPDVEPVLTELGVRRNGAQVSLDNRAPLADVRNAIMTKVQ